MPNRDDLQTALVEALLRVEVVDQPENIRQVIKMAANETLGPTIDTKILFDVSSSMETLTKCLETFPLPWVQQRAIIKSILPAAIEADKDGVDIIPIYVPGNKEIDHYMGRCPQNVTDVTSAMEYYDSWKLVARTPTRQVLHETVMSHVTACIGKRASKSLNLIITTDGIPGDRKFPHSISDTINLAITSLSDNGLDPSKHLSFSFVILSYDIGVIQFFTSLDKKSNWGGDRNLEIDLVNCIFPLQILVWGGAEQEMTRNMILAGSRNNTLDIFADQFQSPSEKRVNEIIELFEGKEEM